MLAALLRFELQYHFKQISFQAAALLFFILGLLSIQGSYGGNEVHKNAPYVLNTIVGLLSMSSIFVSMMLCAGVVMRDAAYKMDSILYATSVTRSGYFIIRFSGLLLSVFFVLSLSVAGLLTGSLLAHDSERGPFDLLLFCHPLLVFGFPNVLFSASLIFSTAVLTRNIRAVYAAGLLLYILYLSGSILGNSPLLATSSLKILQPDALPLLLDPFGLASFFSTTRSWTVLQRNTMLFPITKDFLLNRLLWSAVALLALALTYRFFSFKIPLTASSQKNSPQQTFTEATAYRRMQVQPSGFKYQLSTFLSQFKLELTALFKHLPFTVMLLLWIFLFTIELKDALFSGPYGVSYYPATGIIVEALRSMRPALPLLIFYTAELLWRERTDRIQELVYSTPLPGFVLRAAKSTALLFLPAVLITANICIGLGIQISCGYFHFELPTYFLLYYYSGMPLALFTLLFIFIQTLIPHKYLGMLVSMAVAFVLIFSKRLGIEHYLLRFAATPELQYAYMNGFGHYAKAFHWYMLYWSAFAAGLSVVAAAFWQKKRNDDRRLRIKMPGTSRKLVLLGCWLVWVLTGAYIYHQTNTAGHYKSSKARTEWRILYEKKYKALSGLAQPVIKSLRTEVDLYPSEGKYNVKGSYLLRNESDLPIDKIWTGLDPEVTRATVSIPAAATQKEDPEFGQHWFYLKKPMQPGAEIRMDFDLRVERSGFTPFNSENAIVANGTYLELEKYVPFLGYNTSFETEDQKARTANGLAPQVAESSGNRNDHLINFETTVSTAADQYVVTVGSLQKSWIKDNRRFFRYKTQQPIGFMFALSSAKYLFKRESYKHVNLVICYHPGQEYNVPAMLDAMKNTISYCDENFAPYPFKELTLAEIPQYKGAATAYPGVVFSAERISFLGDFRDSGKINQSYAVTAHEVSHQWWGNLLAPAGGPGCSFLTESLAKYTEMMVLEKSCGKHRLHNYLKAEHHLYFALRNSAEKELPLVKVTDQPFVYYQKGVLAMHTIKESLGEARLNRALSELIRKHAAPFPKAKPEDLTEELDRNASAGQKKLMDDLLKKVVTFDLRLEVISCKPAPAGKCNVRLKVNIDKLDEGLSKPVAPDDDIGIAVFDRWPKDGNTQPVYKQKYHFSKKETMLTLTLDRKPTAVVIDPDGLVLDGDPADHVQIIPD